MRGILLSPITLRLRQIRDVHLAEERQHVVFAHAEELDVPHNHHLVVLHFVERAVDQLRGYRRGSRWLGTCSALFHALRRARQTFTARVFAQAFDQISRTSGARRLLRFAVGSF